jgi:hypothetical protein
MIYEIVSFLKSSIMMVKETVIRINDPAVDVLNGFPVGVVHEQT